MEAGVSSIDKIIMEQVLLKFNKKDLCSHSDRMWNDWCNHYAKEFLSDFDIMFEAKHKNMAVLDFYNNYLI